MPKERSSSDTTSTETSDHADILVILQHLHQATPDLETYRKLMADRPAKFTAEQAQFMRGPGNEKPCEGCFHWYTGKVAGRTVCEIVRLEPESNIKAEDSCRFWSEDGQTFPLFKS